MIDIGKRLRERLNDEARKRDTEPADRRSDSRAWPYGWIAFGAACAAVVVGAGYVAGLALRPAASHYIRQSLSYSDEGHLGGCQLFVARAAGACARLVREGMLPRIRALPTGI